MQRLFRLFLALLLALAWMPAPAAAAVTAPSDFRVCSLGDTQATMTWTPVPGAAYYVIYRSDVGSISAQLDGTTGSYTDPGPLTPGSQYTYRIYVYESSTDPDPANTAATITAGDGNPCSDGSGGSGGDGGGGGETLGAVENLTATAGYNQGHFVRLNWDPPASGTPDYYAIYDGGSLVANTATLEYTFTGLAASTQYCYTVRPALHDGTLGPESTACATTGADPAPTEPGAVQNLTATPGGVGQVELTWQPPAEGADSFRIYDGAGTLLTETTSWGWTFDGLTPGQQYCYTVTAVLAGTEGPGAAVCATPTPPPPVTNVQVCQLATGTPQVTWDPPEGAAPAEYRVERSLNGGAWEQVGTTLPEQPVFLDKTIQLSEEASYRVIWMTYGGTAAPASDPSPTIKAGQTSQPVCYYGTVQPAVTGLHQVGSGPYPMLAWDPGNFQRYHIWKSTDGENWQLRQTLWDPQVTGWTDYDSSSQPRYYQVIGENQYQTSPFTTNQWDTLYASPDLSVAPPPGDSQGLPPPTVWYECADRGAVLRWTPLDYATEWRVYRSLDDGYTWELAVTLNGDAAGWIDYLLANDAPYTYVVTYLGLDGRESQAGGPVVVVPCDSQGGETWPPPPGSPLPAPPQLPALPGWTPPAAPPLDLVTPTRPAPSGTTLPPVAQLATPPDIPAPPALPPIPEPVGLVDPDAGLDLQLSPDNPGSPGGPLAPDPPPALDAPASPDAPLGPDSPLAPDLPLGPEAPLGPDAPLAADGPLAPDAPLGTDSPLPLDGPMDPGIPLTPGEPMQPD